MPGVPCGGVSLFGVSAGGRVGSSVTSVRLNHSTCIRMKGNPMSQRVPVDLAKSYRLLNHGPTVMVSSAAGGRINVMSAAWSMPLDFAPPKVAVVIDKNTFTRELVEASGELVLNVPT